MLKFFRRIRQKLLIEGHLKRYLIYAIGEILLVMIGILLALQVNNRNEIRKERKQEKAFFVDVKNDLNKDLNVIDKLQSNSAYRLSHFKKIDPQFYIDSTIIVPVDETNINYAWLFSRGPSFQFSSGTYNSLISNGQSSLIRNRELFSKLQRLYEVRQKRMSETYESIIAREENLNWKRNWETRYKPYKYFHEVKDSTLIAELNYYFDKISFYHGALEKAEKEINDALKEVENELNK